MNEYPFTTRGFIAIQQELYEELSKPKKKKQAEPNMNKFIYGSTRGSGRYVGNKKKRKIRGMKKRG